MKEQSLLLLNMYLDLLEDNCFNRDLTGGELLCSYTHLTGLIITEEGRKELLNVVKDIVRDELEGLIYEWESRDTVKH